MDFFYPRTNRGFGGDGLIYGMDDKNSLLSLPTTDFLPQRSSPQRSPQQEDFLFGRRINDFNRRRDIHCTCLSCQRRHHNNRGRKNPSWNNLIEKTQNFLEKTKKQEFLAQEEEDNDIDIATSQKYTKQNNANSQIVKVDKDKGEDDEDIQQEDAQFITGTHDEDVSLQESNIDADVDDDIDQDEKTDTTEVKISDESILNVEVTEKELMDDKEKNLKLKLIENIQEKVKELGIKVNGLAAKTKTKDYLYCEEMLTKCLIELDGIFTNGKETIRTARKAVVAAITENINKLEEMNKME